MKSEKWKVNQALSSEVKEGKSLGLHGIIFDIKKEGQNGLDLQEAFYGLMSDI